MCVIIDIHVVIGRSMRVQRIGSRRVCEPTAQRGGDGALGEQRVSCVCVPSGDRSARNGTRSGGDPDRALPVLMGGLRGQEVAAVGQRPVLRTDDVAKEVVIIAGEADRVLIGCSADPVGLVDERVELRVASEEGENEEAAAPEGEIGIHFGHSNNAFDEVETRLLLDERAAVRLDGDVGEGPERGGAVFELLAGGVDVEHDVGEAEELDVAAEELAALFGGEQRAEHVRRNGEGNGPAIVREKKRKKNLWGMRSRMMFTLSRLSGRPIVMSEALKSLSEVTKFHTQGLSSGQSAAENAPFTA